MASVKLMTTKDGKRFWKISVSRGKGESPFSERFYWQDTWSKRFAEQQLKAEIGRFETACKNGEVLTRKQRKEIEAAEAEKVRQEEEQRRAEEALNKTLRQYGDETFMPAKVITGIAENTRRYYDNNLQKHIYPALGDIRLKEIKSPHLQELMLSKQKEGLSHSSLLGIHVTLSQLFKMAYLAEVIDRNPMDRVPRPRRPKSEVKSDRVEAFTAAEIQDILDKLCNEDLKRQVMIRLMIDTGIRRGEACGLKWKSVDFDHCRITIENNLCYTKEKGIYEETPKSGQIRTISISPVVMGYLKRLKEQQKADIDKRIKRLTKDGKPLDFNRVADSEYVFTEKGFRDPMHPQSPTRYFTKFGKKYGIDHFHPHKLRHSFASIALTNNADVVSVSKILGHSDVAVTLKTYSHSNEEKMKIAADVFRAAIGEQRKAQ